MKEKIYRLEVIEGSSVINLTALDLIVREISLPTGNIYGFSMTRAILEADEDEEIIEGNAETLKGEELLHYLNNYGDEFIKLHYWQSKKYADDIHDAGDGLIIHPTFSQLKLFNGSGEFLVAHSHAGDLVTTLESNGASETLALGSLSVTFKPDFPLEAQSYTAFAGIMALAIAELEHLSEIV